jgi:RNA recognition motif-containing protein
MSKAVIVQNLVSYETPESVTDYFSFCGKVERVNILPSSRPNQLLQAIVVFDNAESAQTALFLNGQRFNDCAISVKPFIDYQAPQMPMSPPQTPPVSIDRNPTPNETTPSPPTPITSFISSLIASSYVLGHQIYTKAKEFDEEKEISKKVLETADVAITKAQEINNQYQLTGTIEGIGSQFATKAKQVDENLHLSDKVTTAYRTVYTTIDTGVHVVQAKAMETPIIQQSVEKINTATREVVDVVTPHAEVIRVGFEGIKSQSLEKIERSI